MSFLFFLLTTYFVHAVPVSGTTEACPSKAELIAHEGEKIVRVKLNGKSWKLTADKPFSLRSPEQVNFRSEKGDPMKGEPTLEFQMPGMVMGSLPRLIVSFSGRQETCRVNIYGSAQSEQN